jgi:hypothetical protein
MTYKNFPVYIGYGNREFVSDWGFHRDFMLYANNVSINYVSASLPNRRLGANIDKDNQYVYTSDSSCSIGLDFNFYSYPKKGVDGQNVYGFLMDGAEYNGNILGNGTGVNYFPIRIGENIYNSCFIESYTVQASAFAPLKVSASFKCYDPPEEGPTEQEGYVNFDSYNDSMSGRSVITSNTCQLSGVYDDVVYGDVVPSISFSKRYSRTPVYTLGSSSPTSFLINAVESQMQIQSTGLSNFSDYKGIKLEGAIALIVKDIDGNKILPEYNGGFEFAANSGAKVNAYNYTVEGGDVIKSSATINEVVL